MKLTNVCTNCQIVETEQGNVVFSYGTPVFSIYDTMGVWLWVIAVCGMAGAQLHNATSTRHSTCTTSPHISKAEWMKMPVIDCNF